MDADANIATSAKAVACVYINANARNAESAKAVACAYMTADANVATSAKAVACVYINANARNAESAKAVACAYMTADAMSAENVTQGAIFVSLFHLVFVTLLDLTKTGVRLSILAAQSIPFAGTSSSSSNPG